ncbi:MAG: polyadenylate-specific 3'-exoribonuclease AS [Micromonosporaceae bacterium]
MPYRYFYDCEFIEDGRTIDLVSIGVVDEHGREFYAVSTEFDDRAAVPWVRRNVLDKLPSPADPAWRDRARIRADLYDFLVAPLRQKLDRQLELWAWFAAYDHVVLCQLWGSMTALPRAIPRFTKDLRQRWEDVGRPPLPGAGDDQHDALADARHNLARWRAMGAGSGLGGASGQGASWQGGGPEPGGPSGQGGLA